RAAGGLELAEERLGEMEPGRRRGDGAALARVDGLVPRAVLALAPVGLLARDVRRERRLPDALDERARVGARREADERAALVEPPLEDELEPRVPVAERERLALAQRPLAAD